MPEFYMIFGRKIFFPNFGGTSAPLPPVSYAYGEERPIVSHYSVLLLLFILSFFLFCRLISEVAWPIVTKLCHMFDGDPDL